MSQFFFIFVVEWLTKFPECFFSSLSEETNFQLKMKNECLYQDFSELLKTTYTQEKYTLLIIIIFLRVKMIFSQLWIMLLFVCFISLIQLFDPFKNYIYLKRKRFVTIIIITDDRDDNDDFVWCVVNQNHITMSSSCWWWSSS